MFQMTRTVTVLSLHSQKKTLMPELGEHSPVPHKYTRMKVGLNLPVPSFGSTTE